MSNHRPPRNSLTSSDVRKVSVFIYALCEPETGEIRYIGRSASPASRLNSHVSSTSSLDVGAWAQELAAIGQTPSLAILREVTPGDDSAAVEAAMIRSHIASGAKLLNVHGTDRSKQRSVAFTPSNEGARRLMALGLSQTAIASRIGCSQAQVHHWLRGNRIPHVESLARIEDHFAIPMRAWLTPALNKIEAA